VQTYKQKQTNKLNINDRKRSKDEVIMAMIMIITIMTTKKKIFQRVMYQFSVLASFFFLSILSCKTNSTNHCLFVCFYIAITSSYQAFLTFLVVLAPVASFF